MSCDKDAMSIDTTAVRILFFFITHPYTVYFLSIYLLSLHSTINTLLLSIRSPGWFEYLAVIVPRFIPVFIMNMVMLALIVLS